MQKCDSPQYFSSRETRTDVLAVNLKLRIIVRLIFSEINVGFRRSEYPSMTFDFSNLVNLCRTVLSVILYPKSWRYLAISYEEVREFFPSCANRTLSISSTNKRSSEFVVIMYCRVGNYIKDIALLLIAIYYMLPNWQSRIDFFCIQKIRTFLIGLIINFFKWCCLFDMYRMFGFLLRSPNTTIGRESQTRSWLLSSIY